MHFLSGSRLLGFRRSFVALLAVLVLGTQTAIGAISQNSTASTAGTTSGNSLTFSHTVGAGSSGLLIVQTSTKSNTAVSSITYGGRPLTLLDTNNNTTNARVETWYLKAPSAGAADVVVTMASSCDFVAGASSFSNVDQLNTFDTVAKSTGLSTTPNVVVSSAVGDLVIDIAASSTQGGTPSVGSGQTALWARKNGTSASNAWGGVSTEAGAASVTMSWVTTSARWATMGVSMNPAVYTAPTDIALLSPSGTNLVSNGSFETNSGGAGTATAGATVTDWTEIGGEGFEVWNNFTAGGPAAASNGATFLEMDVTAGAVNGLLQNITTTNGQSYVLSFDFSNREGSTHSAVEVYWQGNVLGTVTNTAIGWQTHHFVVTGSGGSDELKFMESSASNTSEGNMLDNVRLIAAQSPALSIPASSANGTVVATAATVDADTEDLIAYSLTDSAGGRFAINATTGVITVADSSLFDHNTTAIHSITVRATDSGSLFYEKSFSVTVVVPSPPTGFTAIPSVSTVALSWTNPVSDFDSVTIRRSTSGYPTSISDGSAITSGNTGTSLYDTNLDDGTYYYAIFARDTSGNFSPSVTATATVDTTAPSAPNLLASKPSAMSSTINLVWDVPSDTATFTLRRSLNGGGSSVVFANSAASVTSYNDIGLVDGDYVYSIYAIDSFGNVSNAGISSTVTVDTTSPSAPSLSAMKPNANGNTISLSWDVPSTTATFTLRRSTTSAPTSITDGTLVQANIPSSTTSLDQTGLADGTYYYGIFALDAFGNASNAGTSSAVTIDTTSPSPPTLSASKPSEMSNTINLSWDVPPTTATFTLRRSTTSAPTLITDGIAIQSGIPSSTTSLSQTGLADGTYYYAIFALDAYGNVSNAGTAASVTIDTTAPVAPTAFVASATGNAITLSWVNPVSDFASCTIRRSASAYPTSTTDGTSVGSNLTGTSLNQTSLADGTYYYAIFALDTFGNISNSATATATVDTTAPAAPTSFSAVATGSNVALSWINPVAADFSSCTIRRSVSAFPTTITDGTLVAANLTGTSQANNSLADGTYYYAIFAQDGRGNVSVAATASVTVDTTAPVIGTQPTGGTYAAGASFNLTVAATDSSALTYRWYLGANPVTNDANRAGASTATLALTNVTTTGFNGSYTVVVTDAAGNATTSTAATIVVNKAVATVALGNLAVTYTGSPQSATATTSPSGLTVVLTYDGSPTAPTNAGTYAVVGTINDANYQGSASGTLVISNVAPAITAQPASKGVLAGSSVAFTVAVTGAPVPTFQWQRLPAGSGTWLNLGDGGGYSGSTTTTLTVGSVTNGMNGDQFRCVATNVASSATSNAATLTVGIVSPSEAIITFTVE